MNAKAKLCLWHTNIYMDTFLYLQIMFYLFVSLYIYLLLKISLSGNMQQLHKTSKQTKQYKNKHIILTKDQWSPQISTMDVCSIRQREKNKSTQHCCEMATVSNCSHPHI